MSLKPQAAYIVPKETVRVAQAIYPKGNIYMNLYDTFGTLLEDEDFRDLFSHEGQPALSPVRLVLVCILQFVEGLTNRQAAESVRTRIDWKYLLCLELTDAGFDHTVLSEFRGRLVKGSAQERVFEKLLKHFREHGLLKERGQHLWIAETESAKYWLGVLTELKNRGVKDILTSDDLPGIRDAIEAVFPEAEYQGFVVHVIRNSLKYVSYKDRKDFSRCMRCIYKAHRGSISFSS